MNEILPHRRRVLYYETDKMGIVHHSNYIRYMEEGRLCLLYTSEPTRRRH